MRLTLDYRTGTLGAASPGGVDFNVMLYVVLTSYNYCKPADGGWIQLKALSF